MNFAGYWTLAERDPAHNAALLAVAEDWYASTASYRPAAYGITTPFDQRWSGESQIDCSTYSGFVYRGITLDRSKYDNPANSNDGTVSWALNDMPRTAAEQTQMMVARGWCYEPDEHYENLRAGDLLFFAQGAGENHTAFGTRFGHISHVGIVDATLESIWTGGWEFGTFSAASGQPSPATNRARTPAAVRLPLDPSPEGLLLATDLPYCLTGLHRTRFCATRTRGKPDASGVRCPAARLTSAWRSASWRVRPT
jgi:cell wall-associated NlpC family hydrolase